MRDTRRACGGGRGRDDGDMWIRMRTLEMEIDGKIWDIFGG